MGVDSDGVARTRTNKKKFDEGHARIFGKKEETICDKCKELITKDGYNLCQIKDNLATPWKINCENFKNKGE